VLDGDLDDLIRGFLLKKREAQSSTALTEPR